MPVYQMSDEEIRYCLCCMRDLSPVKSKGIDPLTISLSEYHVRCVRCCWPVVKSFVREGGLCPICAKDRI